MFQLHVQRFPVTNRWASVIAVATRQRDEGGETCSETHESKPFRFCLSVSHFAELYVNSTTSNRKITVTESLGREQVQDVHRTRIWVVHLRYVRNELPNMTVDLISIVFRSCLFSIGTVTIERDPNRFDRSVDTYIYGTVIVRKWENTRSHSSTIIPTVSFDRPVSSNYAQPSTFDRVRSDYNYCPKLERSLPSGTT